MSEVCKAQTSDLKLLLYVLIGPIRVSEAKIFPMVISNSGKGKTRKNSFVNFLKKNEKSLFDFGFAEWAGLALSTLRRKINFKKLT